MIQGFFQKRISEILKSEVDIQIVGFANNGREAIEKTQLLNPDVITMDYEMPVMDGLTALRNIMQIKPTPVLMFSSLTYDGARVTLDALDAGAVDFLPKNFEDLQRGGAKIKTLLTDKIKSVARGYNRSAAAASLADTATTSRTSAPTSQSNISASNSSSQASHIDKRAPSASLSTHLNTTPDAIKNAPTQNRQSTRLDNIDLILIGTSTGGPVDIAKV